MREIRGLSGRDWGLAIEATSGERANLLRRRACGWNLRGDEAPPTQNVEEPLDNDGLIEEDVDGQRCQPQALGQSARVGVGRQP